MPNDRLALHYLALIYAACPDASLRNGNLAIQLAGRAHGLSDPKNWRVLTVVAAAHAETNDFGMAVRILKLACDIAPVDCQAKLIERISEYEMRVPFRLTPEELQTALKTTDIACRNCGKPAVVVDAVSGRSGECLECWRKGAALND